MLIYLYTFNTLRQLNLQNKSSHSKSFAYINSFPQSLYKCMLIYLYTFKTPYSAILNTHYALRTTKRTSQSQPTNGSNYWLLYSGFWIIYYKLALLCAQARGGSTKKWKIYKFFLSLARQVLITNTQIFLTTNFASQAQVGVFIGVCCYGTGNSEL